MLEAVELAKMQVNEEEINWSTERETPCEEEGVRFGPGASPSGEGNAPHGQDAWDIRVWFVARSDVDSRQGTEHDEMDPLSEEGPTSVVKCRLVTRDFRPRGEGPRDDLFAVVPPLQAKAYLHSLQGVRKVRTKWSSCSSTWRKRTPTRNFIAVKMAIWNDEGRVWMWGWLRKVAGDPRGPVWQRSFLISTIPRPKCVSLFIATFSRSQPQSRNWGMCKRGCANGTMSVRGFFCQWKTWSARDKHFGKKWIQEGLEYEAGAKHRPSLLGGLGLRKASKTGNSAAVKPEEIGQGEDEECWRELRRRATARLAATLNHVSLGQVGRAICMQILERIGEGDVSDVGVEPRRCDKGEEGSRRLEAWCWPTAQWWNIGRERRLHVLSVRRPSTARS